jgi:hypothetical protein
LLDQVAHFLSLMKSGCDAADFIFDIPSLDCRENAGTMILPSAFEGLVAAEVA